MKFNQFSIQLESLLKSNNLTQSQFAEMVNVTQFTVSCWIRGAREPNLDTFLRICFILKVEPNDLIGYSYMSDETFKEYEDQGYGEILNYLEEQKYLDENDLAILEDCKK